MRWDGKYKKFTADCTNCSWYRRIQDEDLCGWGFAFKYLTPREKPRKCEVKNRKPFFNHSVQYLDEILKN